MKIKNLADLCDYLSADDPQQLNRRIYKDTECGASISVKTPDGQWHHNGEDWTGVDEIQAFTIQSIVENSDATVESGDFVLPVNSEEVDAWIKSMEAQTADLWEDANNPLCNCGHRSEQHTWREVPEPRIAGEADGYECEAEGCDCTKFNEAEDDSE